LLFYQASATAEERRMRLWTRAGREIQAFAREGTDRRSEVRSGRSDFARYWTDIEELKSGRLPWLTRGSAGMRVKVREYQKSDRTAFVELMNELLDYIASVDNRKRLRRMPEFGKTHTRRLIRRVAKENGMICVAESDSKPIGVVVGTIVKQSKEDKLEHIPSKFGEVLELVVTAKYRGKGVGTMLMNKLEEYFKERGCDIMGVGVFALNKNAHRLYYKLGYEDRSYYMTKEILGKRAHLNN
jgi:ribosomal protein S18 acetylase RimI-like enzyme